MTNIDKFAGAVGQYSETGPSMLDIGSTNSDVQAQIPMDDIIKFEADMNRWTFKFFFKEGSPFKGYYPDGLLITHERARNEIDYCPETSGIVPLNNNRFIAFIRMQEYKIHEALGANPIKSPDYVHLKH